MGWLSIFNPFSNKLTRVIKPDVESDGSTGGTGSAGAGNQYVVIEVSGVKYKVLHDGIVS